MLKQAQGRGSSVIRPIQYLRGVAAMMVVWHHSLDQVPGLQGFVQMRQTGIGGVDLFFVVSGFIILVTTVDTRKTPGEFLVSRIIRVVPLYWLATMAMVCLGLVWPGLFRSLGFNFLAVLKSLLFIPYFSVKFPEHVWPVLIPGWTLNFEMFFYCLFAALLFAPQKARLTALIGALVSLVLLGYVLGPFQGAIAQTYTSPQLLEFAAGALIGRLWIAGAIKLQLVPALAALILGFVLLMTTGDAWFTVYLHMAGAAIIVAASLAPAICRWELKPALALGDASYAIYLAHVFVLGALRTLWGIFFPGGSIHSAVAFVAVGLGSCAIIGRGVYLWIEKPLLGFLKVGFGRLMPKGGAMPEARKFNPPT